MYQYGIVPFRGQIKSDQGPQEVSRQLSKVINKHVSEGWEFVQLTDVNIQIANGCLQSLFGNPYSYHRFDQIIMRREMNE